MAGTWQMKHQRLFPLSGIAFVALIVASLAVGGGTPSSGASAAEVAAFYDDDLARQFVSTFILAASALFVVLFGVGLASLISSENSGTTAWSHVVMAGAILVAGSILVSTFVHMSLVDGGDQSISPTALQALNSLDGNTWIAFTTGLGILMLGAAGGLLSSGAQRWVGWTALVLGIALFIPFADFIAMLVTAIWIVVVGATISRGTSRASRETPLDRDGAVPTTT